MSTSSYNYPSSKVSAKAVNGTTQNLSVPQSQLNSKVINIKEEDELHFDIEHSSNGSNSPSSTTLGQTKYSQSPVSELKEGQPIEELKESGIASEGGENTVFAWGKPLKKPLSLNSDEKVLNTNRVRTQVVRVVKPKQPDEDQDLSKKSSEKKKGETSKKEKRGSNAGKQTDKKKKSSQDAAQSGVSLNQDKSKTNGVTPDTTTDKEKKDEKKSEVAKDGKTLPTTQKSTNKFLKYLKPEHISTKPSETTEQSIQEEPKVQTSTTNIFSDTNIYNPALPTAEEVKDQVMRKLTCSVLKTNIFDNHEVVLGYPIDIEKNNNGRSWPAAVTKILSRDAFVSGLKQKNALPENLPKNKAKVTSQSVNYEYWLPIYINEEHFERSKHYIFDAIRAIYCEIEDKKENTFQSEMVLKVLPPLLVKTAVDLLQGPKSPITACIEVYCQIHQLLVRFIKMFPSLQRSIDQEITDFCSCGTRRDKETTGHLAEVLVKLSLSSYGIDDPNTRLLIFKEHLARQVVWALRKNGELALLHECKNFVQKFLTATQSANQFILVITELARVLLDKRVADQMEERYGFLDQETMKRFRARVMWIQKNVVGDWKILSQGMRQGRTIVSEEKMRSSVMEAFGIAAGKGYV